MRHALLAMLMVAAACSNDDPTFMKVCPQNGSFVYPVGDQVDSTACSSPVELIWPGMPLKVVVDPELDSYHASFDEAFAFWERGVGGVLFVRALPGDTADVAIVLGSANDPGLAATAHHVVMSRLTAIIEIRKPGDVTEMVYVAAHELGHVVDLAHDPNNTSIMNSTIEDEGLLDDPGQSFQNLWVTDNDRNALRSRYFP
jgi:hypothetical protein